MPDGLPNGVEPGQIYRHPLHYQDSDDRWKSKCLLVLAPAPGGDVIYRLLTSRAHGRPKSPPCYHGDPYPGYFLGILGAPLVKDSWLDLSHANDYDGYAFAEDLSGGALQHITDLPPESLCEAMECVARVDRHHPPTGARHSRSEGHAMPIGIASA